VATGVTGGGAAVATATSAIITRCLGCKRIAPFAYPPFPAPSPPPCAPKLQSLPSRFDVVEVPVAESDNKESFVELGGILRFFIESNEQKSKFLSQGGAKTEHRGESEN
jgi:hypothetical protein